MKGVKRRLTVLFSALGLALVLLLRRADDGPGPALGWWIGKTSEGRPMQFYVADHGEGLVIDEWFIMFDLRCEITGRTSLGGIISSAPIPIADRKFAWKDSAPFHWLEWDGGFGPATEAHGAFELVWPELIGTARHELATEKCVTAPLTWSAAPGEPEDSARRPELLIRLDRDPSGAVRTSVVRP